MEGRIFFQIKDLKKHLTVNGFTQYTSNKIGYVLKEIDGATKTFWNVRGKGVHVWSIPEKHFNDNMIVAKREIPQFKEDQVL